MKKPDVNGNGQNEKDVDVSMNINADENIEGTQHLNEPVAEESEMENLKAKVDEMTDKYLRQAAEFDNFKRRNARERIELIQTAGRDVITDLLEVLDDAERAIQQLESAKETGEVKEGVQLVFNKLRNKLAARGLKVMETKGKDFNPDLHEAITEVPGGEEMKGKVVDELVKGYYLNDKIIRFAKVVVGK